MGEWLPYLAPITVAAIAYLGGRYQARLTAATARDTATASALDKRDERLWTQLVADNARITVERDYWRDLYLSTMKVAERSLDKAEQLKESTS